MYLIQGSFGVELLQQITGCPAESGSINEVSHTKV
jgi:hypothetical protein